MKKAERQRIDALELWCWRRLFKQRAAQTYALIFLTRTNQDISPADILVGVGKDWLLVPGPFIFAAASPNLG